MSKIQRMAAITAMIMCSVDSIPANYLYISSNRQPDSIQPVVLLETELPLTPPPAGFSLASKDTVHNLKLLTPTEAMLRTEYLSNSTSSLFGSFIHAYTGECRDTAYGTGPLCKIVIAGGWTRSRSAPADTAVGIRGKTVRNGIIIPPEWTPWSILKVSGPLEEIRYARCWCYLTSQTYVWEQFSEPSWWWQEGSDSTYSGVQRRY
ncbi:MAG: hypothetical protein N2248_02055 [candidate division WOR-3 bacterium]|uniref:Uncharacterized protein n=1 Tax=candidate division WOR-3 bacterium TaxID=2052148 RepID=A0A7C1NMN6_UNCW3|nr:hypothetical protein [candidate division WOR-3 bacterium]